ncbi:hypothetical protein F4824DRAFT_207782 [Ustulina deusta]|nr:hypothetical protein F4824DRAFT_207782 [Ustulina deusta]
MSSSSTRPDEYEAAFIARRRQLVENSRGQRTRQLRRKIKDYLEPDSELEISLEQLIFDCNWIFDTNLFGPSTDWLKDILWRFIWDYMETHALRLCNLLRYMVAARKDRYGGLVFVVLDRIQLSAMQKSWKKWVPFCGFVGQLAHDEFNIDGAESWNPSYVLGILLNTFANSQNSGDKKNFLRGAAKCVSKLDRAAAENLGKSQYVAPGEWQSWIERFEIFANDATKSDEARADASNAASVMRY